MDVAQMLKSYGILIKFLVFFIFMVLLLLVLNPKGFNKTFGYEIFITIPMLLIVAYLVTQALTYYDTTQTVAQPTFVYIMGFSALGIAILSFFLMMYVAGIFDKNPPQNNTSVLVNLFIFIVFFITLLVVYTNNRTKDNVVLQSLPPQVQELFNLRTKYTIMFVSFVILITLLYFLNPYGIMTHYAGPVVFLSLFVGILFVIMITVYHNYLSDTSNKNILSNMPTFLSFFVKGFYILFALFLSGLLIYGSLKAMGAFNQDASKTNTLGSILLNLLVFTAMLGVIYKLANAGGFLDKNPLYRLGLNTIFYIPCLLVTVTNYIFGLIGLVQRGTSAFSPPKPFEYKMLGLSLALLSSYFLWNTLIKRYIVSRYLTQGGEQLLNSPVSTNTITSISTKQFFIDDKFNYQYALSFWFYLDSFPLNTSASYLKNAQLLSHSNMPSVKYNPSTNTLFITVVPDNTNDNGSATDKLNTVETDDIGEKWINEKTEFKNQIEKVKNMNMNYEDDSDGNKIIYKDTNVLLQKWNQVVFNYNGGTLDVFYNGKLVKSAIEIVPYMKLDMLTIGSENGVSGNIANVIYFKQPLDLLTINTLYTSLKDENPPSI